VYGPRAKQPGKLTPFEPYLQERMQAGVWNARVLLRELRERGFKGGYRLLTDWLRPQRESARTVAVRRFETPPGQQAQVDWGHLGTIEMDGEERKLWGFAFTLGYRRTMMAEAALDQKLGTLLRMREQSGDVEVHFGCERIAVHGSAPRKYVVVTQAEHPLAAYESAAMGGGL
jgi:transposase